MYLTGCNEKTCTDRGRKFAATLAPCSLESDTADCMFWGLSCTGWTDCTGWTGCADCTDTALCRIICRLDLCPSAFSQHFFDECAFFTPPGRRRSGRLLDLWSLL